MGKEECVRSAPGQVFELSKVKKNRATDMSASSEADEDARAIVLNKETWTQRRRFVKEIYLRKLIAAAIREDMVDTLLVITDAMDTG